MNSIVYVGMDVHKESYTMCSYTQEKDKIEYQQTIASDEKLLVKYLEGIKKNYPNGAEYICGYEAGCLGYELYRRLTGRGIKCVILAPTTIGVQNTRGVKTDKKDAANIAKSLAFGTYSAVYVPTEEDDMVKEYVRMRDDQKKALKAAKQQLLSLLLRHGQRYTGTASNWTKGHERWLRNLNLGGMLQETLSEYLITYEALRDKVERMDKRIEEIAEGERYREKVNRLVCLLGIKSHTALSMIVEVGDFMRFARAEHFASYVGLVPGEESSGGKRRQKGITKAGNSHLRRLLVESAQSYPKGRIGYKSKELKRRQRGNSPEVIAYADKSNERLRRKFYRMTLHKGVKRNIAVTAIARELACFIWGMMTDRLVKVTS